MGCMEETAPTHACMVKTKHIWPGTFTRSAFLPAHSANHLPWLDEWLNTLFSGVTVHECWVPWILGCMPLASFGKVWPYSATLIECIIFA